MLSPKQVAITQAEKAGALYAYVPVLDKGQERVRKLWLRKDVNALLNGERLDVRQRAAVHAALKRFVVGGRFTVLLPGSTEPVENTGDIKVLQGADRLTVEMRFKPPRYELRLFGRFIGLDELVLMSPGMKDRGRARSASGEAPLNYATHVTRCESFMSASLKVPCPQEIAKCITNARFR